MLIQAAQALTALADAADRLTSKQLTVEVRNGLSDQASAEQWLRNLRPAELAALKKKLGL